MYAISKSSNSKTGPVAATYAPQQTCPQSCPFRGQGCYAESGPCGFQTARVNRASEGLSRTECAKREASEIDALPGNRPLRLHVVGDCANKTSARILARAARRYIRRQRQPVWTYTHSWRAIARQDWGDISVLASCETTAEVMEAHRRGYAVAIAGDAGVPDGFKRVTCPATKRDDVTCASCGLCWRREWLYAARVVVHFPLHGAGAKKARRAIEQKTA